MVCISLKEISSDLEMALFMWFKDVRAQNFPISGLILQEKANKQATGLGIDDFYCLDGCLHGYGCLYNSHLCMISSESGDVITEQADQWKTVALPHAA